VKSEIILNELLINDNTLSRKKSFHDEYYAYTVIRIVRLRRMQTFRSQVTESDTQNNM